MRPVRRPTSAIGRVPEALQPCKSHDREQMAECRLDAVGSKPKYA